MTGTVGVCGSGGPGRPTGQPPQAGTGDRHLTGRPTERDPVRSGAPDTWAYSRIRPTSLLTVTVRYRQDSTARGRASQGSASEQGDLVVLQAPGVRMPDGQRGRTQGLLSPGSDTLAEREVLGSRWCASSSRPTGAAWPTRTFPTLGRTQSPCSTSTVRMNQQKVCIGPDSVGNPLEFLYLQTPYDDAAIHAMPLRTTFRAMLRGGWR